MQAIDGLAHVLSPMQLSVVTSDARLRRNMTHHHIAFVLSRKTGHLLASATNCATPSGSVHAEAAAMMQFEKRLKDGAMHARELRRGVDVLSLRLSQLGELRLAKPCAACTNVMRRSGHVRRIRWSENDGNVVSQRTR